MSRIIYLCFFISCPEKAKINASQLANYKESHYVDV